MSEYKPTEYVVDFGDYRSNQFVRLNMALIDHNGAKLQEKIVRCRDCACWYRGYCGRHSYEVANQHGDTYTEGLFPMDEDDFCSLGERMEVGE